MVVLGVSRSVASRWHVAWTVETGYSEVSVACIRQRLLGCCRKLIKKPLVSHTLLSKDPTLLGILT